MPDTGWNSPTANESNTDWTNPQNMETENAVYATATAITATVKQYNFNITIPSGATIDGIEVRAKGYRYQFFGSLWIFLYYNGRATQALGFNSIILPASNGWNTAGSPTNLWGESWVVSDFTNANFAVKVDVLGVDVTDYVDAVQAKIYYTESWDAGERTGVAAADIDEATGNPIEDVDEITGT